MQTKTFSIFPIGFVRTADGGFCLELNQPFAAALQGLEGFSHLQVLWWCHYLDQSDLRQTVTCEQPYKSSPAQMGIFATRSPVRPNPIGLSITGITRLDTDRGIIHIDYIDADTDSPLLDIKPYHPCSDRLKEVTVPDWCRHWPQWYEDSAAFNWADEFVNAQ